MNYTVMTSAAVAGMALLIVATGRAAADMELAASYGAISQDGQTSGSTLSTVA